MFLALFALQIKMEAFGPNLSFGTASCFLEPGVILYCFCFLRVSAQFANVDNMSVVLGQRLSPLSEYLAICGVLMEAERP